MFIKNIFKPCKAGPGKSFTAGGSPNQKIISSLGQSNNGVESSRVNPGCVTLFQTHNKSAFLAIAYAESIGSFFVQSLFSQVELYLRHRKPWISAYKKCK